MAHLRIQEGQYTQRIYTLVSNIPSGVELFAYNYCLQIKEQNYGEVVQILNYEIQSHPKVTCLCINSYVCVCVCVCVCV